MTAINHVQLGLNRTFSDEEIKSCALADLMIDEDFDFETTVSLLFYRLESFIYWTLLNDEPESVPSSCYIFSCYVLFSPKNLAADRKDKFHEEIRTLTGSLKAHYDQANKEYAGIFFLSVVS